MRPIFIICEGIHDIAVMGPLLERAGYQHYVEPIKNYPPVISKLLVQRYQRRPVDEARSGSEDLPARDLLPVFSKAYFGKETLILFFVAKSDSADAGIRDLLTVLVDQVSVATPKDERINPFGIFFVRDADEIGIPTRVARIKEAFANPLASCLPSFATLEHAKIICEDKFSVGCWIFSKPDELNGVLEDALESELKTYFGPRWADADAFINKFGGRAVSTRSRRLKSTITVSGQTEHPGVSQAVVLREVLKVESVVNGLCNATWMKNFENTLLGVIGS